MCIYRSDVFTAMVMMVTLFWDVTPCCPLSTLRRTLLSHVQDILKMETEDCSESSITIYQNSWRNTAKDSNLKWSSYTTVFYRSIYKCQNVVPILIVVILSPSSSVDGCSLPDYTALHAWGPQSKPNSFFPVAHVHELLHMKGPAWPPSMYEWRGTCNRHTDVTGQYLRNKTNYA